MLSSGSQLSNAQRSSLCMTSLCFLNDDGKLNSLSQSLQKVPASDASLCLYFGGSSGFVHLQIYIHNSCNCAQVGTHQYPHQRDACNHCVLLPYDSPNLCWKLSLGDKLYSGILPWHTTFNQWFQVVSGCYFNVQI